MLSRRRLEDGNRFRFVRSANQPPFRSAFLELRCRGTRDEHDRKCSASDNLSIGIFVYHRVAKFC